MNFDQNIIKIPLLIFAIIGLVVFSVLGIYGFAQMMKNTGLKSELSDFAAYIASITIKREVVENPKPEIFFPKVSEFPKAGSAPIKTNQSNSFIPGQEMARNYPVLNNSTYGKNGIDLAVNIIDTGIVTEPANTFTHAETMLATNLRSGIVFEVTNLGNTVSGFWYFHASLPTNGGNYTSDRQEAIPAGGKVRYTIGFQGLLNSGDNQAVITIDPEKQIPDVDRANNVATATLKRGY